MTRPAVSSTSCWARGTTGCTPTTSISTWAASGSAADRRLQLLRAERVADIEVAAGQALAEPAHALRRGAMGEAVGHHVALALFLQLVVADRGRRGQRLLGVAGLEDLALVGVI